MTDCELLETCSPSSPAKLLGGGGGSELPDDLLREATQRLGLVAYVWAGLFAIGVLTNDVVGPLLDLPMRDMIPWGRPGDVIAALGIVGSIALARYTRRLSCSPRLALDLALGFEVLLALGIGIVNQWEPHRLLAGRLSWICVLVLIFPMLVPNTPRKTLVVSVLAASMDPFGILVAHWRGVEVPGVLTILWNYLPNYVCALLAVVPSHIMTRMGRQVQQARELGSYRLEERIGRGGMGEVWRATHRMLARPAAVKVIKPELLAADPKAAATMIQRFRREAEAASFLESPHTIRLYDFGETRAGTFYFVLELLNGLDLDSAVRRHGPLPPERVIHVLRQALHSLAEAHERGLVHRDIKPANIYLCRVGREFDFVKVLDFGLVKFDHEQSVLDTIKTTELTTGTPAFMAPEMANSEPVDRRADLYALGCVAYWLLTGKLVFDADSALRMLIQHIQAEPVPPSRRAGIALPDGLEALVLRLLEKDPARRPQTADEVLAGLDRIAPVPAWDQAQAREWWERHLAGAGSETAVEQARRSAAVLAIRT